MSNTTGSRHNLRAWAVPLLVLLFVSSGLLEAQTSQEIVGTIRDRSGGVIPGVSVTARHLETNDTRQALTNDSGDYRLIRLRQVGRYEVKAEMVGFKTAVAPEVVLETGRTLRVDLTLQVGEVTESVTVEGAAPLVRSETSSLEVVVTSHEIQELPLYGRNFLDLTRTTAGASTRAPGGQGFNETNLVVGGARARDNEFRIDGIRAMSSITSDMTVKPPIDAIQEFQLLRHLYSAEYGRAMGAIVEVRTKSGSNDFHGSVYEFGRRGNWSAKPFFASKKPVFVEDDFGGSIGGPVWIPGLYDGRNRTFFFYNFEKFRSPSEKLIRAYMLTDAERNGDFSQSVWGKQPIDPLTMMPFPNGVIPANRFSPPSVNMLKILPHPNQGLVGNFNWQGNVPDNTDTPKNVLRIDNHFSDKHSLFGSAMWTQRIHYLAASVDCGTDCQRISDFNEGVDDANVALGYGWTISPRVVWEVRAGYSYHKEGQRYFDQSKNYAKEWGFAFFPPDAQKDLWGAPRIRIADFADIPGAIANTYFGKDPSPFKLRLDYLYNLTNTVSINKGDHYIKLGADIIQDRERTNGACGATGQYFWGGSPPPQGTTNRAADFLLGMNSSVSVQFTPQWSAIKRWQTSYFIQDDWKISRKLTLNLGLRHDYFAPYESLTGRIARYDLVRDQVVYPEKARAQLTPQQLAALKFSYRFEGPALSLPEAVKTNFSPRIGIAFRPFGTGHTVVRAGYGIFYTSPFAFAVARNWRVAPWQAFISLSPSGVGRPDTFFLTHQLPPELEGAEYKTPGNIRMPENGFKNAYAQHWNLTIQTSLSKDMALEVGYVGTKGVHLEFERRGKAFASLYGFKNFAIGNQLFIWTSSHDSEYNAMQVTLQKRYSAGLSFRGNYTWGKLMNDTPESFDADDPGIDYGPGEWARGQADVKHNFNFSGIYELPFGRGRVWGTGWARGIDAVLGGWKLNFFFDANSGAPVNISWAGPLGGSIGLRPDLVPGKNPVLPKSQRTRQRWFDVTAFRQPACYPCQGNFGRNVINGPNFANLDLGISKIFQIPDKTHTLEIRGEMFNGLNHPNLVLRSFDQNGDQVDLTRPNPAALQAAFPMRRIQLAVRYAF